MDQVIDVSKVFLNKIQLSEHAREQAEKRGISVPTIQAVVDRGASTRTGNAVRFALLGFVVILDGYKVVTVYEDR